MGEGGGGGGQAQSSPLPGTWKPSSACGSPGPPSLRQVPQASPLLPGFFRFHRFDASCCCAIRFGLISRFPNALLCLWSLARVTSSCSSILS